ncbi:MAG: porphobilinogen synthase [Thermoguttaceae bacterium]|nr:porphobilinogen synthase [Thermoguttaceae bacterium]MBQ3454619.1 porphobilinogen synthase [Thermoguttaceae bacterium]
MQEYDFLTTRLRRLRYNPRVRRLAQSVALDPAKLILPLFVRTGKNQRVPIASMPGNWQLSIDELVKELAQIRDLGIGGVMLFGVPEHKDAIGSDVMSDDGIIAQAIRASKDAVGDDLLIIADVCFCEYTDHGHCGVLKNRGVGPNAPIDVDNDATLSNLVKQTLVQARAGVDMVAPSGMIDGMIGAIRQGFDENGFEHLPIMSYAAKYASAFYGPFRDAAESAPSFGDRRTYQMDPAADPGQALREVELDIEEGADMVMVKPALAYLDIVRLVNDTFPGVPLAAYNVSGEFSMVKAAALNGWIDEKRVVLESLTGITRAGASIIITYWAKDVAAWL